MISSISNAEAPVSVGRQAVAERKRAACAAGSFPAGPFSADEVDLASLWFVEFTNDSGRPFYVDLRTKETGWTMPEEYRRWKDAEVGKMLPLSDWFRYCTPEGRFYYRRAFTQSTFWEKPGVVLEYEAFLAQLSRNNRRKAFAALQDMRRQQQKEESVVENCISL